MGHIFIICGPPGSGKTTLLKTIAERSPHLRHLQRITTRERRPEEGDSGKSNSEYEFLTAGEFAGRLARGHVANFIEWNQKLYATDLQTLENALRSPEDHVLHEDMPSALHLKRRFGSNITVILLFPDDKDELLRLEFALLPECNRSSVLEWQRRLGLKYADAERKKPQILPLSEYIGQKMSRALPDLAFMVGRLRAGEDIRVIPNRSGKQEEAFLRFQEIVGEVKDKRVGTAKFAFVLMPFCDNFDKLYNFVIKPTVEGEGITCWRGDEIKKNIDVMDDVIDHIRNAQFIIADISGGNPNVFLELGICLQLEKRIIIISRDADVPFNARTLRRINYEDSSGGWEKLSLSIGGEIRRLLTGALNS